MNANIVVSLARSHNLVYKIILIPLDRVPIAPTIQRISIFLITQPYPSERRQLVLRIAN